jgi:hypothetical protein
MFHYFGLVEGGGTDAVDDGIAAARAAMVSRTFLWVMGRVPKNIR